MLQSLSTWPFIYSICLILGQTVMGVSHLREVAVSKVSGVVQPPQTSANVLEMEVCVPEFYKD